MIARSDRDAHAVVDHYGDGLLRVSILGSQHKVFNGRPRSLSNTVAGNRPSLFS